VCPYSFADCYMNIHEGVCYDDQVFLPRWMCLPLQIRPAFEVGDRVKCWWHYYTWDAPYTSSTPDSDSELSYPKLSADFLEVSFTEEVYLPPDYLVLWVLCFGFLSALPIAWILFVLLPCFCGVCEQSSQDCVLDYCEIFWCCRCNWRCLGKRRFFQGRSYRNNPPKLSYFEKIGVWMKTSKLWRTKGIQIPTSVVR
jgi:hypothetical protein